MKIKIKKRAFSLVECLVALAILGLIVISILPLLIEANTKENDSRTRTALLYEAKGHIEAIKASYLEKKDVTFQGRYEYEISQAYDGSEVVYDVCCYEGDKRVTLSLRLPKD